MKKIIGIAGIALFLLNSCTTQGVKKDPEKKDEYKEGEQIRKDGESEDDAAKQLIPAGKEVNVVKDENNIKITWFEQGKGKTIEKGKVYKINYDVRLEDGTLVDGNQLLKRDWLPFLTGFGMQTRGWDIAFEKLRVGDFVEIFLPAAMARGEKGIKGLIPPNSNNIIHVRILEELSPTRIVDGTSVWLLEENKSVKTKADQESEVIFHYMVGTPSNPKYDISYRRNTPFSMRFSDNGIVKGLKKALIGAKRADKLWVVVPASEAYGKQGLVNLVQPDEPVFYDILVLEVDKPQLEGKKP